MPAMTVVRSALALTLAITLGAGCRSTLSPVSLSDREKAHLVATLRRDDPGRGKADLDAIAEVVLRARNGVVLIQSREKPRFLGYLGGLGACTLEAVREFPDLWEALDIPFYVAFGWILQFFQVAQGTGF